MINEWLTTTSGISTSLVVNNASLSRFPDLFVEVFGPRKVQNMLGVFSDRHPEFTWKYTRKYTFPELFLKVLVLSQNDHITFRHTHSINKRFTCISLREVVGYELISNYIRNHLYNMYELPCAPLYRMTNNTELARREEEPCSQRSRIIVRLCFV